VYIADETGLLDHSTVAELVFDLKRISATLQSIVNAIKKRLNV